MTNKPTETLRDGLIKATIWENATKEGEIFYSVDLTRSYKKGDDWKETHSFSGAELLRASALLRRAYDLCLEFKSFTRNDADNTSTEFETSATGG